MLFRSKRHKPAIVIVELGANDALRGLSLSSTEANLRSIVGDAQKAGAQVVLVGMRIPPNYGADYTAQFKGAFARVANKAGVPLLPFLLENVGGKPELNQADAIHPNEKGHAIVADTVFKFVKGYL